MGIRLKSKSRAQTKLKAALKVLLADKGTTYDTGSYLEKLGAADIDKITEQFMASLLAYPGMHVQVRIIRPIRSRPTDIEQKAIELIKQEVIERTCEMLKMMDILYERTGPSTNSLMILEELKPLPF